MKSMIRWTAGIAAVGASLFAAGSATAAPGGLAVPDNMFAQPAAPVAPTTVVATVESKDLTQGQVDEVVDRALTANRGRIPPERMAEARAQIGQKAREEMIVQMILEHEADAQKIEVKPEDIEKARVSIPLPPGQTLQQALAAQNLTQARLDQDLTRALRIKALVDKVLPKTEVTDAAAREFYDGNPTSFRVPEQATARHILIKIPDSATDPVKAEMRAKAEDIRKQLVGGGDFAALAKQHSDDPGSKDAGGSYTFPRGQMVKPFEEAAFTQKLDEIGPLVETQFGFHIIQTTKREEGRTVGFEEAAPRIRAMLASRTQGPAIQEYIQKLREKTKVAIPGGAVN